MTSGRERTRVEASRVQTVLGPVDAAALGPASIHEHLLTVLDHVAFRPVDSDEGRAFADAEVSLATRWWVRQQWVSVRDNLRLTDEATAIAEVLRFAAVGGGAIADPTTDGIGRDPEALARISRATGVHVVMGAGYYVHGSHPTWIEDATEGAIVDAIVGDLVDGVGLERIRAGFIGEIGCSWPMTPRERRVLRAAGLAQKATGAPLMVHPGRDAAAPDEILRELSDVGAESREDHDLSSRANGRRAGPARRARPSRDLAEPRLFRPRDRVLPAQSGRSRCRTTAAAWRSRKPFSRLASAIACCWRRTSAKSTGSRRSVATATTICCAMSFRCWSPRGHSPTDVDRLVRENPARFLGWEQAS